MEHIYALVMLTFMNIKIERLALSLIYLNSNYLSQPPAGAVLSAVAQTRNCKLAKLQQLCKCKCKLAEFRFQEIFSFSFSGCAGLGEQVLLSNTRISAPQQFIDSLTLFSIVRIFMLNICCA